jgi:hypothetical protein
MHPRIEPKTTRVMAELALALCVSDQAVNDQAVITRGSPEKESSKCS